MIPFLARVSELNDQGWQVNNCFQLKVAGTLHWRVNIHHTKSDRFSAFGDGATPDEALSRALKTIDLSAVPVETPADDLENLLG